MKQQQNYYVAIPFDPGQVSTEQIFGSSHLPGERGKVAIPFDPGQVSTDPEFEIVDLMGGKGRNPF